MMPNISNSIGYGYGNLGVPPGGAAFTGMRAMYVPNALVSVVFVGTNLTPYTVIDFSQRNNFVNGDGYCYVDIPNSRLVFLKQPTTAQTITYDYKKVPDDILIGTSPLFRAGLHNVLAFGAAARFDNLQLTDKASSYQRENQSLFDK
jgi:hypothetical protein